MMRERVAEYSYLVFLVPLVRLEDHLFLSRSYIVICGGTGIASK